MKKTSKKNIIFFLVIGLFLLFAFLSNQTSAQRELEVKYPEIFGFKPKTVETFLPEYTKYIFNFFIAIVGFIGFAVLVWAGVRYLVSAGKPEEQKKAKQQIKFAFLGILLLLFSYLILTTINPQLIVFEMAITPTPPTPPIEITVSPFPTADLLERIKELAVAVKQTADAVDNTAQQIKSLTDNCDCSETEPACICKDGGGGNGNNGYDIDYDGDCEAIYCYASKNTQPCPDDAKIKENQKKIVDLRDVMLYYKNRVLAEIEDLKEDLERVIAEKLKWFENKITAEKKVLEQCKAEACRDFQQKIIESLEKDKTRLEKEKGYKEKLKEELIELAMAIEKIKDPSVKLAALPDQCLSNIKDKCSGSCQGGCHDEKKCAPGSCSGGNPCPMSEIENKISEINSFNNGVRRIADEIIRIVEAIPKET